MWQITKKTGLIVFSSLFILMTGIWLCEAAPQLSIESAQKISEDIREEVDSLYRKAKEGYMIHDEAADILERAYKTEPEKRQEYVTAIKEYPDHKRIEWDDERSRIQVEFLLELLENSEEAGKYFERLEAKKAGKVEVSSEVRQDVEKFFKRIDRSRDRKEREEAYWKLRDEKIIMEYAAHEYVIALKEHPWPEDKELRELVEEAVEYFKNKIDSDHFRAEVQPRIDKYEEACAMAEVRSLIEAFFSGIRSSNPSERKEAMSKLLETPDGYVYIERPQQYINEIRKHPWPEDETTKAKIEMVLEILKDQNDFFTNRWEQVSSPTGKAEDTPETIGCQSTRADAVTTMAAQNQYDKEHWPSIIRDKNRKPLDRFYAAFYLARFYVLTFYRTLPEVILQSKTKTEEWEHWPEEWDIELLLEAGNQSRSLVLRLCADEDKEVSFLMQLGLAYQRYLFSFPGRGNLVPAAIKGLEHDYLYFRLLSQDYLEQITGEKFDLDPTDPPAIRAPAIKKWRKWWDDNLYRLYYDEGSERLLRYRSKRPDKQTESP